MAGLNVISVQVEAAGLTAAQRTQAGNLVIGWLAGKTFDSANVTTNYIKRGVTYFFIEVGGLITRTDGDDLFETIRGWLSTRATDFADGSHSYVRLAELDRDAKTDTIMRAESPGWIASTVVVDLTQARAG